MWDAFCFLLFCPYSWIFGLMDSPILQRCEAIRGFTYVRQTFYLQAKSMFSFLYIPTQTKKLMIHLLKTI